MDLFSIEQCLAKSSSRDIAPTFSLPDTISPTNTCFINHTLTNPFLSKVISPHANRVGSTHHRTPHQILSSLLQWGHSTGCTIHPHIAFGSIDIHQDNSTPDALHTSNWGVFALEDIPPDQIILAIPSTSCLQPFHNLSPAERPLVEQLLAIIPPQLIHMYTAIRLFFEFSKGEGSDYFYVIQSQPQDFPTIALFDPNSPYLSESAPYMLKNHVLVMQTAFETYINAIMTTQCNNQTLFQQIGALFPRYCPSDTQSAEQTVQLMIDGLIWSYYVATSRSFGAPGPTVQPENVVFVPILDMVNHSWQPNCLQFFEPVENDTTTPQHPLFKAVLKSGPNGIKQGEELTFSYAIADFEDISQQPTPENLATLHTTLTTTFNIDLLYERSLLRLPQVVAYPDGMFGGKDNAFYACNYGFIPPFQVGDLLQLRSFSLHHARFITPSYDYLAANFQTKSSNSLNYNDAPIKFLMPNAFSHKKHFAIIQSVLSEIDHSQITQFSWLGPDFFLIGLCRLFAAAGSHAEPPSNATTKTTPTQSRQVIGKRMDARVDHVLAEVEKRIAATAKAPAQKMKKGQTKTVKPPFSGVQYLQAISDSKIDDENEYAAMIMLYMLLCCESEHYSIPMKKTVEDYYLTFSDAINESGDVNPAYYIRAMSLQYEFLKKSLILHGLKVLTMRLGIDSFTMPNTQYLLDE